jgi:hypothetical protein
MIEPALVALKEWESFYVIIGSSAAALTGLQFVVIALGAEAKAIAGEAEVRAFATPTVVHFCAVLLLSALLSTPGQTPRSLGLGIGVCGVSGLVYGSWVVAQARRQKGYAPVLSDWVWHGGLPILAYASLFAAAVTAWHHPVPALYLIAATALLLLFIGIHNAWDAAVWMAHKRKET